MGNDIFVNRGFTFALSEYLNNKNNPEGIAYNSFSVMVIRLLTVIYDELDIINPYYFNNYDSLITNLIKYGYSISNLQEFFKAIDNYYTNENSDGFLFIQKCLIDMFMKKNQTLKVPDVEKQTFRALLYSPYTANPLRVSYNYLMAKNPYAMLDYYDQKIKENVYRAPEKPKETLNIEAYEALKYSIDDIKNMSAKELDEVNKQVYNYFDINDNAINKKYLLDQAVYNHNHPKTAFASGGFMSILFFVSILAAVGIIVLIVTLILL